MNLSLADSQSSTFKHDMIALTLSVTSTTA